MEAADTGIMRGGSIRGSSRANSNSIWRNSGVEVFSRASRNEADDEEALKWAALEKLPTFDRLRKGLMFGSDGRAAEVDIDHLGFQERQALLKRLVNVADEDNEKFLLKLRNRIDRVGIDLPTIEVRYEHLNVEAYAYAGSRALPSFINFFTNFIEDLQNTLHITKSKKRKITILNDATGIIKPCRMTLLLGPPAAGKTTLLLALAGKLDKDLKVGGKVTYNGHELNEFVPQRTAAYISQYDLHIGEMTVRETLEFSAKCQGIGSRYEMLAELTRREKAANIKPDHDIDVYMKAVATEGQEEKVFTDYVLKILGLEVCADTMVGDQMIRGISGGQKRRVTTGEMLAGPAKALFMDEISTGLDSSTTFSIINSLRQYVHILKGTAVISLLQPAPETYNLFDDIILLSDGYVIYHGPREEILDFFDYMGFKCPQRKGVADFLQEVTSKKDQQQYWTCRDEPYRFVKAKEFAEAYKNFDVWKKMEGELSVPFNKTKSHPAALTKQKYGIGKRQLLKACTEREYLLMQRNSFAYIFKFVKLLVIAFIYMTIFLRTEMKKDNEIDGGIYLGALCFSVVMIMFSGFSEISLNIYKLPVFYKQRDLLFFPPWAYAIPSWILKVPITIVEVGIWVFVTYYVIGLDPNVGRVFKHFLIMIMLNQMASSIFRLIGGLGRIMTVGNTFGSVCLLLLFSLCGFVLSRDSVKSWWIWGYWSSPLTYAMNAVLVIEFKGKSWRHFAPGGSESIGDEVMRSRGFLPESKWYWIGVGALFGFMILFNVCYTLALQYLDPLGKIQAMILDDENNEIASIQNTTQQLSSVGSANRGMILPFEPHSLTFDNVVYSVDMPLEMKEQGANEDRLVLLKGVSGSFRPGVLTALMGVSGAGKTTLMDVLAGRKTGGYIDGDVKISGFLKKQETFARIAGYCEQNDIHSPFVTVHESLIYSAWLRLPENVDASTRKMFVNEVMELVELTPLRSHLVGLPGVNGLSTEQRKRLTISVELVANPSIIFMDEPTSGLDARAAAIVMRTVRNTVDTGRTVVCTIHQPNIDIFEAFDELFLMKRGGQEIYVGQLGHNSCHLIKYFESIHGVGKIKDGYNPATWMLEVSASAQEIILGVDFSDIYKNSDLYQRNKALIRELSTPCPNSMDLDFPTQYPQNLWNQFLACLWKQHWSYWRNTSYSALRFLYVTIVALILGSIFWDMGTKKSTRQDLFNAMGSMYAAILFIGVQHASAVQPVVVVERTIFYREKAAGMYSAFPYAISQVVIEIPYIILQSAVYCGIVYAMVGFEWTPAKFLWYFFMMFFSLLYFTLYGMMCVAVTSNEGIAAIISVFFYTMWNLFSGFNVPRPSIPVWWRWYVWACPMSWTLYGLVVSQFGDIEEIMSDSDQTVKQFLDDYFGFKHNFLGVVAAVIVALPVIFGFIFAFAIKTLNFQTR
ncbi:unnamed protein product [Cuscuta epithymum]|uniref:ABC transporter domain-containing protein n=1 Tax=Cuscuta epithymum TaxID=186058 RepID=A0AAV0EE81_9ASTE|nr:unnamed protein product [Cuscuta epithymum]